jgi:hypothetical protein
MPIRQSLLLGIAVSGNLNDHGSADDLMAHIKVNFAFIVKGRDISHERREAFVTRPNTKVAKDGICRDRPFLQSHRVRYQVRSCLTCLHLLPLECRNHSQKSAKIP